MKSFAYELLKLQAAMPESVALAGELALTAALSGNMPEGVQRARVVTLDHAAFYRADLAARRLHDTLPGLAKTSPDTAWQIVQDAMQTTDTANRGQEDAPHAVAENRFEITEPTQVFVAVGSNRIPDAPYASRDFPLQPDGLEPTIVTNFTVGADQS